VIVLNKLSFLLTIPRDFFYIIYGIVFAKIIVGNNLIVRLLMIEKNRFSMMSK